MAEGEHGEAEREHAGGKGGGAMKEQGRAAKEHGEAEGEHIDETGVSGGAERRGLTVTCWRGVRGHYIDLYIYTLHTYLKYFTPRPPPAHNQKVGIINLPRPQKKKENPKNPENPENVDQTVVFSLSSTTFLLDMRRCEPRTPFRLMMRF